MVSTLNKKGGPLHAARTYMDLSHRQWDPHNMCNGVVGETSELFKKLGGEMSQEYQFVVEMNL
jgi:hypothetical protein